VNMAATLDEEKPWKTDLARKSAQRREGVLRDLEENVKKAPSFEEALSQTVEQLKRKFARFSGVTAYVADGEDLVVQTSSERPAVVALWPTPLRGSSRRWFRTWRIHRPGPEWAWPVEAPSWLRSVPRQVCGRSWRSGAISGTLLLRRTFASWRRFRRPWRARRPRSPPSSRPGRRRRVPGGGARGLRPPQGAPGLTITKRHSSATSPSGGSPLSGRALSLARTARLARSVRRFVPSRTSARGRRKR
jgi:hypothetical protein